MGCTIDGKEIFFDPNKHYGIEIINFLEEYPDLWTVNSTNGTTGDHCRTRTQYEKWKTLETQRVFEAFYVHSCGIDVFVYLECIK